MSVDHLFDVRGRQPVSLAQRRLLNETRMLMPRVESAYQALENAVTFDDAEGATAEIRRLLSISLHLREYANLAEELRL